MKKLFVLILSLVLLNVLYSTLKQEYRRYHLDAFYSQQFATLYQINPTVQEIERLEYKMRDDGYNWKEIAALKNHQIRTSFERGNGRRFDLQTLRSALHRDQLKGVIAPFYEEMLHKQWRAMLQDGFSRGEIEEMAGQALRFAQEERVTSFGTPVELN